MAFAFSRSCARTAIGKPCGLLSPKGAIRGFHVPLTEVHRVRCLLLAGRHADHEDIMETRRSRLRTFWCKRQSHFRLLMMTTFNADSHVFTLPAIWHSSGLWLPEGSSD